MNYRFTSAFDVAGTRSFRLSSRKAFGEYGGNEQNLPELHRAFLIADPGKHIFQVDQSGAEALVVAHLTEPGYYRELFDCGIKPHTYLALNIFTDKFRDKHPRDRYQFRRPLELAELPEWSALNKSIAKDPANVVQYQLGKMVAHAAAYKMGPETFRLSCLQRSEGKIVLTFQEAKSFLTTYGRLFPEIIEWQTEVELKVSNDRVLYNLFGFPRTFYGRWNQELVREAISFIPQSTVGVLTSLAFTDLFDYAIANKLDWECLINAHDAVVGQAPVEEIKQAVAKTQEFISRPITTPRGETFRMKSEAVAGPCWCKNEMEEVK